MLVINLMIIPLKAVGGGGVKPSSVNSAKKSGGVISKDDNNLTSNPAVSSGGSNRSDNFTDNPAVSSGVCYDNTVLSPAPSSVLSQSILPVVPPLPSSEDFPVPRGRAPRRTSKPTHPDHSRSRSWSGASGRSEKRPAASHKMPAYVKSVPSCP